MGRLVPILLSGMGLGALWLADAAWKSVTGYRTPYAIRAELPGGPASTERLALVILDGIRRDRAEKMPNLVALAARGNRRTAQTVLPSLSNPARATMVTGAEPEVHGVTNNGRFAPPPVDSLFSLARQAGLPVAVYGGRFFPRAFGEHLDPARTGEFEKELHEIDDPETLVAWQRETCDAMVRFLAARERGLLVAEITASDEAGHDWGGRSEQYFAVVEAVDDCLGRLIEALDDGRTSFIVVSDHGHIHRRGRGGHGGAEPEVLTVPLVLAGRGIRAGAGTSWMTDIAPTAAALLGLPIPANNQGAPIGDALDLDAEARAALDRRVVEQGRLYAERTPKRADILESERRARTPQALGAALALAGLLVWAARRTPVARQTLFWALAAFVAVYAALFWAFGLGYSLSAIVREEYLDAFFAKNMASAAAAFVAAAAVARRGWLGLGLIVAAGLGLRVAAIHWRTGLTMKAILPDLDLGLTAYLDLLAVFAVSATAVVAAGVAALIRRRAPAPGS